MTWTLISNACYPSRPTLIFTPSLLEILNSKHFQRGIEKFIIVNIEKIYKDDSLILYFKQFYQQQF